MKHYGAIEAGGTKFVCAVGTEKGEIIDRLTIPTETPEETIGKLTDFFSKYQLTSMGVGSFGPISVAKNKEDYGYITNTPKLAWKGYPFIPELEKRLGIPVSFTTDVNAAALGELTKGEAQGLESCISQSAQESEQERLSAAGSYRARSILKWVTYSLDGIRRIRLKESVRITRTALKGWHRARRLKSDGGKRARIWLKTRKFGSLKPTI